MCQKHKKNKYIILNLALRFKKLRNKQKVMLILKLIIFFFPKKPVTDLH